MASPEAALMKTERGRRPAVTPRMRVGPTHMPIGAHADLIANLSFKSDKARPQCGVADATTRAR